MPSLHGTGTTLPLPYTTNLGIKETLL